MSTTTTAEHNEHDFQARPPKRTTTNLSVDFIESSISLAEDSRYVAEINRWVPVEEAQSYEDDFVAIWDDAFAEREKLEIAVNVLREKTRPKGSKAEIVTPAFTWKQVMTEVNTATETYKNSAFARTCDKSGMFEQWLSLLPNDSYSATISGAFVMGVQAARSISAIQKSIHEALASIPDVLEHAGTYIELYKAHNSIALVQKTASLCKSILTTLRLVIEFITQKSLKRITGAMFKGSHYQLNLKESIDEMKLQALRVREEANVCSQKRLREVDQKSDARERKADIRAEQERRCHELEKEELYLQLKAIPEATAQMVLDSLLRSIQSLPSYNRRTGGPLQMSGLLSLLDGEEATPITPDPEELVTAESLLAALDFDPEFLQEDMQYCLKLGFAGTPEFQDRAAWVLKAPAITKFMGSEAGSKMLLVHGNHDATHFISPLSYVCAKVADLMSVSETVICLTYFCSRHTDGWREPQANAQGLLAQLTGQLLNQLESRKRKGPNLDFSSVTVDDQNGIEKDKLSATWRAFETVMKQFPKDTVVFCFIDGLSAYENSARRQETTVLMKKLCRLIRKLKNTNLRCVVTYPGRSNYTDTWGIDFDGKKAIILEVPENV